MSNTNYLVFEDSNNVYDMKKINVFANGCEMPWTYYQTVINLGENGYDKIMYTSESKFGPNGEQPGEYVSQIRRRSEVINNPTIKDYENWGWKLSKDADGNKILPKYGEFTFIKGQEADYEELSTGTIDVKFKFGFGLNNTCYNYATEDITLQIFNLSKKPEVYCSEIFACPIEYNEETNKWNDELSPEISEGEICCDILEGENEAYLFVQVEAGETIEVSFPYNGTDLSKGEIDVSSNGNGFGQPNFDIFNDASNEVFEVSDAYRTNVKGGAPEVPSAPTIRYDFYRIVLRADEDYNNLSYQTKDKLCVELLITPKSNGVLLENFSKRINVQLNLKKNMETKIPKVQNIDGETYFTAGSVDQNISHPVLTPMEKINYVISNNLFPEIVDGRGIGDASGILYDISENEEYQNLIEEIEPKDGKSAFNYIENFIHYKHTELNISTNIFGLKNLLEYNGDSYDPKFITKEMMRAVLEEDDDNDFDNELEPNNLNVLSKTWTGTTNPYALNMVQDKGHHRKSGKHVEDFDDLGGNWAGWVLQGETSEHEGKYKFKSNYSELCDLSGVIAFNDSSGGDYYNIYVDGVEIPESLIGYESDELFHNTGGDTVEVEPYDRGIDKLSNDEYFAETIAEFDFNSGEESSLRIVKVDNYEFFRVSNSLFYVLSSEFLDYEKGQYHHLPKIKVELNADPTCFEEFEFFHELNDSESILSLAPNNALSIGQYKMENLKWNSDDGAGGVRTEDVSGHYYKQTRWSKSYLPIDLSGVLERGEEFKINIASDQYKDDNINTYSDIPSDCPVYAELQYCFANENIWKNAKDVVFEYECHNQHYKEQGYNSTDEIHQITDGTNMLNSRAGYDGKEFDYSKSSNIKGLPKFRLCMPTQNELFSSIGISSNEEIRRQVNLDIEFLKGNGKVIGNNPHDAANYPNAMGVEYVISNQPYEPTIEFLTYSGTERVYKNILNLTERDYTEGSGRQQDFDFDTSSIKYVVSNDVISKTTNPDNQLFIADDSKFAQYTIDVSGFPSKGDKEDLSQINILYEENKSGIEDFITQFKVNNFKYDGENVVNVTMEPIFKLQSDVEEYRETGLISVLGADVSDGFSDGTTLTTTTNRDGKSYEGSDYSGTAFSTSYQNDRVIPMNSNYSLIKNSDETSIILVKNSPFDYESRKKEYPINDIGDYADLSGLAGKAAPDVVKLLFTTTTPGSGEVTRQNVILYIYPKNENELIWDNYHVINVESGATEVDLSGAGIFNAEIENYEDADISYNIVGVFDESGFLYVNTPTYDYLKDEYNADMSNIVEYESGDIKNDETELHLSTTTGTAHILDIIFDASKNRGGDVPVSHLLDTSKILYVDSTKTTAFKYDTQKEYKFLMEAYYSEHDNDIEDDDHLLNIERQFSIIHIVVDPSASSFKVNNTNGTIFYVNETFGDNNDENAGLNNSPIILENMLERINHHGQSIVGTNNELGIGTHIGKIYSYKVIDYDSDLELEDTNDEGDEILNKIEFKLKEDDINRTTEGSDNPNVLAPYVHYNYERKDCYNIEIEVGISNSLVVKAEKAPLNYICSHDDQANSLNLAKPQHGSLKTADWIVTGIEKVDGTPINLAAAADYKDINENTDLYLYNSETELYEGPLKITPDDFEQLNAKKIVDGGLEADYAYVRFEKIGSFTPEVSTEDKPFHFKPLFKSSNFRDDLTSPPTYVDSARFIFQIKVTNSLDVPKENPQAYKCNETDDFFDSDPNSQDIVNNKSLTASNDENLVANIFIDHNYINEQFKYVALVESTGNGEEGDVSGVYDMDVVVNEDGTGPSKENASTNLIPTWSSDYNDENNLVTDPSNINNRITRKFRYVHPYMDVSNVNEQYNYGLYNGDTDSSGLMNGSTRYGFFKEGNTAAIYGQKSTTQTSYFDPVIVDMFVEMHGSIDASGYNEIHLEDSKFGERIDYSGTNWLYEHKSEKDDGKELEIEHSDKRMYRLHNIVRNMIHDDKSSHYTKAQLKVGDVESLDEECRIYKFSIAAVTNYLANMNDISYNPNMVDLGNTETGKGEFYDWIEFEEDSNNVMKGRPQPFQKYVYDPSAQAIVTKGFYMAEYGNIDQIEFDHNLFNLDHATMLQDLPEDYQFQYGPDNVKPEDMGVLLTCRTHFCVKVEKGEIVSYSIGDVTKK